MSPVNALQHIGELRRRDDNNAIGRRGPDKLAALQPLGVKATCQTVMPKHLHEVAPASTEHEEITGVRIALQRLLHLQSEAVHATAHVGMAVAIHTRTPEGMGIIAAAVPSSPRRQIRINGAGNTQANAAPNSSSISGMPTGAVAVSVVRPAQIARSQQA